MRRRRGKHLVATIRRLAHPVRRAWRWPAQSATASSTPACGWWSAMTTTAVALGSRSRIRVPGPSQLGGQQRWSADFAVPGGLLPGSGYNNRVPDVHVPPAAAATFDRLLALCEPARRDLYFYVAARGEWVSRSEAAEALDLRRGL